MKDRVARFRQEFIDFRNMEYEHVRELIMIYDAHVDQPHTNSNPSVTIIGGFIVWAGGLVFNASSGRY